MSTHNQTISSPDDFPGKIELVLVTSEIAKKWLEEYRFQGQRNLDRETVLLYAREMQMGRFDAVSQINLVQVGPKTYLTDGQHRLQAVALSNVPIPFVVRTKTATDETEAARDYNASTGKARTVSDSLRATGIQESLELNSSELNVIAAATSLIVGGFSIRANRSLLNRSVTEKEQSIREWAPDYAEYQKSVLGAHQSLARILKWRGVVAVGLVTFRYAPFKASQFWGDLVAEEGRSKAGTYLERRLLFGELSKRKNMASISRNVAEAWNRFFLGKSLPANFHPLADTLPIYIAGSPFNGSQQIELFPKGEVSDGDA